MKIILCDDDVSFLDYLECYVDKTLNSINQKSVVLVFDNGERVLNYVMENRDIDIIILDILMGDINGIQIAKKIRQMDEQVRIIFLSSTSVFALESYDVRARYYLTKPLDNEKLYNLLCKEIEEIENKSNEYIVEKNDDGISKILLNDILYIDTGNRHTIVHAFYGEIISYKSMKLHMQYLSSNFVRCHTSYIVNLDFIKNYHINKIEMCNGEIIWVSKNKRKDFLNKITQYYGELL